MLRLFYLVVLSLYFLPLLSLLELCGMVAHLPTWSISYFGQVDLNTSILIASQIVNMYNEPTIFLTEDIFDQWFFSSTIILINYPTWVNLGINSSSHTSPSYTIQAHVCLPHVTTISHHNCHISRYEYSLFAWIWYFGYYCLMKQMDLFFPNLIISLMILFLFF